jgi:N-acetylornithine carbamoyltransferase
MLRHFLDLADLDTDLVRRLLGRAGELERHPRADVLRGRVLGLLFMNPSLRTLASFQAGMAQLGGSSFVITPGQGSWSLETAEGGIMDGVPAEHVKEAIPVLASYADALGVRCFAEGADLARDLLDPVLASIVGCAPRPLINLESAVNHPCQALADWKTLDDLGVPERGGRFVLSWAWHPKPLPLAVPAAAVAMAAQRGMDVTVLAPPGFALPSEIMTKARTLATASGGSVRECSAQAEATEGAHVIYAKSWQAPACYGDAAGEAKLRAPLRSWCVEESWFAGTAPNAAFMHCLPVRRNVVVADEILDGPRSAVLRQAANRLHAQKAVLWETLADDGSGSR